MSDSTDGAGEAFDRGGGRYGSLRRHHPATTPPPVGQPQSPALDAAEADARRLADAAEQLAHLARLAAAADPAEARTLKPQIAAAAKVVREVKPRLLRRMGELRAAAKRGG